MRKRKSLDEAIKEIKELTARFKEKNGNTSLRIPNKDFNLWMVNWAIKQDGRIIRLEATTKIMAALFCGMVVKLIMF